MSRQTGFESNYHSGRLAASSRTQVVLRHLHASWPRVQPAPAACGDAKRLARLDRHVPTVHDLTLRCWARLGARSRSSRRIQNETRHCEIDSDGVARPVQRRGGRPAVTRGAIHVINSGAGQGATLTCDCPLAVRRDL